MLSAALLIGSTNVLELTALQDTVTGAYPTDAEVTASLALAGQPVTGAQGLPLAYVAGTTDEETTYRGELPATVALTPRVYTLTITAADPSGNQRTFVIAASAVLG